VRIRDMRSGDVDAVIEIERISFPTPWSRRLFEEELHRDFSSALVACEDPDGPMLGYAVCWTVSGESHLLNIAVRPEMRDRGVGRALLRECIRRGARKGARKIYLEVRPTNAPAIHLYESEGFIFVGIRRNYYTDTGEDALLFSRRIGEEDAA
jgi:[ribosomal protein S18]-alanine N-acetyltransferase